MRRCTLPEEKHISFDDDLSLSGPIVISESVGAMAGFVNDMWQRPVTDLGIPGQFGGKGGKQLIVGPKQEVPQSLSGYKVVRSKSNYVLYLTRIFETDPELKAKLSQCANAQELSNQVDSFRKYVGYAAAFVKHAG